RVDGGAGHSQRWPVLLGDVGTRRLGNVLDEALDEPRQAGSILRAVAEWTGEGDHLAHCLGMGSGEIARIDAAEAQSDQADGAPVAFAQLEEPTLDSLQDLRRRAVVGSEPPPVHPVS